MRTLPTTRLLTFFVVVSVATAGCLNFIPNVMNKVSGPGDYAEDFIRADKYPKILVEIDYVDGFGPNEHALDVLRSTIRDALQKEVKDVVVSPQVTGEGKGHKYTLDDVVALEEKHRNHYRGGDTAVLYMLYLDGGYEADGQNKVLGAAYRGSSVVMFKGNIRDTSRCDGCLLPADRPQERFVERAIIVHELGHILGLVNSGIPMQRPHEQTQDPVPETPQNEGDHHSRFRESVMYWAVESSQIGNIFDGGSSIPYKFDEYDLEDIRAVREGRT